MSLRHPTAVESARQARRSIALVQKKLLNPMPKVLESCTPHLRAAVDSLTRLHGELAESVSTEISDPNFLRNELLELRGDIKRVNALLRGASEFYDTLAQLITPPDDHPVNYTVQLEA